jgi:hypothetical protein
VSRDEDRTNNSDTGIVPQLIMIAIVAFVVFVVGLAIGTVIK